MNSNDLTAKLLAQENLKVIRTNARTASFDVGTRVLALPLWKDMTPEIESLFILHEVGHALFTTGEKWIECLDNEEPSVRSIMKGYMNVVEDARIEKLVKRTFPGSRKTFFSGYTQLNQRDFFKLKNRDINAMLLIDRINLYFKAGQDANIKFDEQEAEYVRRIELIESIDDMILLSKEIYEFAKSRKQKSLESEMEDDINFTTDQDFEDEESQEVEYDYEEGEDVPSDDDSDESNETDDSDLESETDKNLNESLEDLADTSTTYTYYEFYDRSISDPVIPYKKIIAETVEVDQFIANTKEDSKGTNDHVRTFDKFMIESERMVNYLVKEFEMRKSATAYRRTQISKSGSLSMNKIHAYKLTDDIFRRIATTPTGKNHGMVFLLDWSGSMDGVIDSTIKQVINLAMFCRRINIPYEVYAFTTSYDDQDINAAKTRGHLFQEMKEVSDKNIMFSHDGFNLLNLFSSKMTTNEFKAIARRFTSRQIFWTRNFTLGGTPLNDALLYFLDYVPKFKRANNIDKLSVITLTDGQGASLYVNNRMRNIEYGENGTKVKIKNFVTDQVTQKTYQINADAIATSQSNILISMLKDRYDVTTLGFYICKNRRADLYRAHVDNTGIVANPDFLDIARSNFSAQGFYSMVGTGRDELFIVPDSSTVIDDSEVEVDNDMSAATIARKLTRSMVKKKTSRILLDKFIGYVA